MTTTNDQLVEVLNDLVKINNDRVEGYERAADEAKDVDITLKAVFNSMADESRKYASELAQQVKSYGGDMETGTTTMGKIYRTWMDVKAAITGKDRHAILASCEYGEDQAQKAYNAALESDAEIDAETRQLITSQQASLKASHDNIKKMRDASK